MSVKLDTNFSISPVAFMTPAKPLAERITTPINDMILIPSTN